MRCYLLILKLMQETGRFASLDPLKQYSLLSIPNFLFFSSLSTIILAQPTFISHKSRSKDFFPEEKKMQVSYTVPSCIVPAAHSACVIACPQGRVVIIQHGRCNLSAPPPTKYLKKQFYPQSNKIPFHHRGCIYGTSD